MADSDDLDDGWGDDPVERAPVEPAPSPRVVAPAATAKPQPSKAAAPSSRRGAPDRATLPPPMPEQEYIEKILATEEAALSKPRQRLNTLIEHDPLQYDAAVADENTRPTKPPASAVAAGVGGDDFLDLSLGELGDRASAPELALPPPPLPPASLPPRPSLDSFDDLPIGDVLESIPPGSLSGRALGSSSILPPSSVRPAPAKPPPGKPSTLKPVPPPPPPPRAEYDSSPTIEVVEVGAVPVSPTPTAVAPVAPRAAVPTPNRGAATTATATPAAARAKGPARADGNPEKNRPTTPAMPAAMPRRLDDAPASSGVAVKPHGAQRVPSSSSTRAVAAPPPPKATPKAGAASGRPPAGAVTPAAGTKGPHLGSGPPGARTTERPTRALRTPVASHAVGVVLDKVVERFEAGDFGRALMLAEQAIESGDKHEDLLHYAELCREKLRQTYVERIGSGRTILRVMVDAEKLRDRALDPRLAFLLSLLDGASTVDDVIDMSTMPALEAVRALHELLQEGVVEVVQTGRRSSAQ